MEYIIYVKYSYLCIVIIFKLLIKTNTILSIHKKAAHIQTIKIFSS